MCARRIPICQPRMGLRRWVMRCMPSVVALRSVRGAGLLRALSSRRVPSACANHEPISLFTRQIRADVDLAHLSNHHSHLHAWTNLQLPHRARRSENSQVSGIDAHTTPCRICQPRLVGTRKIQTRSRISTCTLHYLHLFLIPALPCLLHGDSSPLGKSPVKWL